MVDSIKEGKVGGGEIRPEWKTEVWKRERWDEKVKVKERDGGMDWRRRKW